MFFDFFMSNRVRKERDSSLIDGLIKPPVPCCQGNDDPLGRDGKAAWDLTTRLVPRGHAENASLLAAQLQPGDDNS